MIEIQDARRHKVMWLPDTRVILTYGALTKGEGQVRLGEEREGRSLAFSSQLLIFSQRILTF